jgi:hypothetical protein
MHSPADARTRSGGDSRRDAYDSANSHRAQLTYIQGELTRYTADIVHDDLRRAVQRWLVRVDEHAGGVSNARDAVTQRLGELKRGHQMYRPAGAASAAAEFPDDCKGCPHYDDACPVLTDDLEISRRERIMREADDDEELRRGLREYAMDHNCHVILEELSAWRETLGPLLAEGRILLFAVEGHLLHGDSDERTAEWLARTAEVRNGASRDGQSASTTGVAEPTAPTGDGDASDTQPDPGETAADPSDADTPATTADETAVDGDGGGDGDGDGDGDATPDDAAHATTTTEGA